MRAVNKCHRCGGRFERSQSVKCPDCGRRVHQECLEYHAEFECRKAKDPAVGALDF